MENEISVQDAFKRQIESNPPMTGKQLRKSTMRVERAYGTTIEEGDVILSFRIDNPPNEDGVVTTGVDTVLLRNLDRFSQDYELVEGGPEINLPKFKRIRKGTD